MAEIHRLVRDAIREREEASERWSKILELCRREKPSSTWDRIPAPDFTGDILLAQAWLNEQVAGAKPSVKGIYLGLDTINMESGSGTNVEIGTSGTADPGKLDMDWMFHCDRYGQKHLIESLVGMKAVYKKSDVSSFADYILFLGYTGIVLLAAVEAAAIENDFIAVWGFHDGDIYFLARKIDGKLERLVRP